MEGLLRRRCTSVHYLLSSFNQLLVLPASGHLLTLTFNLDVTHSELGGDNVHLLSCEIYEPFVDILL